MRVIITGGTGLIGRALSDSLTSDRHEVIVLSRDPGRHAAVPAGVRVERWDARSAAGWGPLAEGADAIVNLAGENIGAGRWTTERKRRIRESRVNAGRAVVQAVTSAERKPGVVVQASAVGYYGPRETEEVTEEAPPGSDFLSQVGVDWENATASVEALGVRRVIMRSGLVLSMQAGVLPRLVLPTRLFVGGPQGSGRQWWPWIHIVDEVAAIRFLIESQVTQGPYNLVTPRPVTNAEFLRTLGRALGRPAVMPAPSFVLRLLLGEMADVILSGQRAVPGRLLESGFTFLFTELEEALRDLIK